MVSILQIINKIGNCIECGSETNIQLDCGEYACLNCLNRVGKETHNIREYIERPQFSCFWYSTSEKCDGLIEFLSVCRDNNITSIDSAIKTLNAIKLQFEYKMGTLDAEKEEKIEKQLDFFMNM